MAQRPIFIPNADSKPFVITKSVEFEWHPGFAISQKQKCIRSLHDAAKESGISPVLEISTKSEQAIGRLLSAFNLKIDTETNGPVYLECAFQGAKVFESGGPYIDLFTTEPKLAKRDSRLKSSGELMKFAFEGLAFPLMPKTLFYDWLYINAATKAIESVEELLDFQGYSDIEFNPNKSINCQAHACALMVALMKRDALDQALINPSNFLATVY